MRYTMERARLVKTDSLATGRSYLSQDKDACNEVHKLAVRKTKAEAKRFVPVREMNMLLIAVAFTVSLLF